MKLSTQAIGALMMALQKSLIEQTDIVPVLQGMNFVEMDNGQLLVENPPHFAADGQSAGIKFSEKDNSSTMIYGDAAYKGTK
jgi:hypothetical protein